MIISESLEKLVINSYGTDKKSFECFGNVFINLIFL